MRNKKTLKRILLLLNTIIIFILILELVLIIIPDKNDSSFIRENIKVSFSNIGPEYTWHNGVDPYFLKDVDDLNAKKTLKILNLGDSVTDAGCPQTQYLEELFNKSIKSINYKGKTKTEFNIINGGLGGANTYILTSMFLTTKEIVKPDVVTILSGWNDHWYKSPTPCQINDCYNENKKEFIEFLKKFNTSNCEICKWVPKTLRNINQLALLENCKKKLDENPEKFLEGYDSYNTSIYRVPLDEYKNNLKNIIRIAQEDKIEIILVTPPSGLINNTVPYVSLLDCTLIDKEAYLNVHEMYVEVIREVAKEEKVPLIDLDKKFKEHPKRFTLFEDIYNDPIHVNGKGQEVCAEMFYEELTSIWKESINKN